MPSTTLTFVLPLDEPLDVSWADDPSSRGDSWASVSGVHVRPAAIHHDGSQRGIQLALTTAGARVLFGVPASALAGGLLDLADVDPAMADLPERLAEAAPDDRVDVVWEALAVALHRHDAPGPRAEVGRALALLTRGARVAAVAAEVGYSRRRLSTLVRDEVGVTPQDFHRLGRFERSHDLMRRRAPAVGSRSATWPRSAATPTTRTSPASGSSSRAARRVRGSARSSPTFKPGPVPRLESEGNTQPEGATMTEASTVKLWHTLSVRDADAMIAWLRRHRLHRALDVSRRRDTSVVHHAEWLWPGGGGLMFGTQRPDGGIQGTGPGACYVVTDDPDAVFDAAISAGGTVERPMVDQDYGGRGGSVRDPEGNHWSFGSYQPS